MARVELQPLWQQKHPTPSNGGWEYHWHPAGLDPSLTGAIAALDLALGGGSGFVITPGWIAWVRAFSAEVPSEQRSYIGLSGIAARVADPALVAGTFAALALPAAAPFAGEDRARAVDVSPCAAELIDVGGYEAALPLARLVVAGCATAVPSPEDPAWPARLGRMLAWLPATPRTLSGVLTTVARPADALDDIADNAAHYLARGWTSPGGAAAWRLICATGRPLLDLFADLGQLAAAWETAADLAQYLRGVLPAEAVTRCDAAAPAPLFKHDGDAGTLWNRIVHYWGRGFLTRVESELARVLAGRVLVDHLVRLDDGDADLPQRYLRRLRYEALLPAARATALVEALRKELGQ